jgi:transcriptional regulator with XRE-family HTH domain
MTKLSAKRIGEQFKRFREARELSLRGAAEELGVSYETIRNCERGRSLPALDLLVAAMDKWHETFLLNGYEVVPKEFIRARAPKPQPIQGAFPRFRPRAYKAKTVRIRQRQNELVITTVAKINTGRR